jgi:hypothetical protein
MKSPRGVVAATAFLSALPLAVICQHAFEHAAETVIHFMFALGSGFLCSAIADFHAPRWAVVLGYVSTGVLAVVFALQGTSELTGSAPLTRVAYQVLGQHLEGWLVNGLIVWCFAALLAGSRGVTRLLGLLMLSVTAGVRAYVVVLSFAGPPPDTTQPALKLFYLLPFVWLLLESLSKSPGATLAAGRAGADVAAPTPTPLRPTPSAAPHHHPDRC